MKRTIGVVIALALAALPAAASARVQSNRADLGIEAGGVVPSSSLFSTLVSSAPTRYQRMPLTWDWFGTWNGSQCVAPTTAGSGASTFISNVTTAEQLGETPVPVVGQDAGGATNGYVWPAGAQTPVTPDDQQYECGIQLMLQALATHGLSRAGMPIEAFNEPDNATNGQVDATQAAHYVSDLGGFGSQIHPIAGSLQSPYPDQTYANTYANAIKATGYAAASWAVHDYNDVIAPSSQSSCSQSNLSACDHQGISTFLSWLQSEGLPTSDVWITEAGDPSAQCCGTWLVHSRSEEAHTAYDWEQLRSYAKHVFWFQWQTYSGDGWDSAIVDASGHPRPSYCVIAFNENPSKALGDSRCPGS